MRRKAAQGAAFAFVWHRATSEVLHVVRFGTVRAMKESTVDHCCMNLKVRGDARRCERLRNTLDNAFNNRLRRFGHRSYINTETTPGGVAPMKMIRAILRPETAETVSKELADSGFVSMTQINVFGRGKQKGITIGTVRYEELPKTLIMMVVEDRHVSDAMQIIKDNAYTGNYGDGKIFISPVEDAITVRTGTKGL
jgi:nitrogen regulatory protein PII 1